MTDISQPKRDCCYFYEQAVGGKIYPYCMHYSKRNHAPCPEDCDRYLHNNYKVGFANGIQHVYEETHVDTLEKLNIHITFDDYCKNCSRSKPILKDGDCEVVCTFEGPQTVVTDRYLTCEKIRECRESIRCYKQYLKEKEKENE